MYGCVRFIACFVLLVGCVNAPYKTPPSTANTQKAVNTARGDVDKAMSDNEVASEHNRKARTKAELIDNKASVIEKFWK
jgi:hypothetical protein